MLQPMLLPMLLAVPVSMAIITMLFETALIDSLSSVASEPCTLGVCTWLLPKLHLQLSARFMWQTPRITMWVALGAAS